MGHVVPLVEVRVDAGLPGDGEAVVGARTRGAIEVPEAAPVGRQVRQRVAPRQLDHHASRRVRAERDEERREVGDVVDHVVAHDHVRSGSGLRVVGPAADDLAVLHTALRGRCREQLEHRGPLVHPDHQPGRRRQWQRGTAAAAADVEHRATVRERLEGALVRRRCELVADHREHLGRQHPRVLRRLLEDLGRDRPRREVVGPPLRRRRHGITLRRAAP